MTSKVTSGKVQAHTPTPWQSDNDVIFCNGHFAIAKTIKLGIPEKESKANAAFIVRACNSHEELLEACKSALILIAPTDQKALKRKLEQAIAKAEGK